MQQSAGLPWWQGAVVYQVYPRSFAASATRPGPQPGVGTLAGISERLEYLAWLGVDALWLSPIFASPMADFGYDVADYCAIDPLFGTMADFDELLARAHALGLKVLLDWVPNHTSDRHPWFQESRRDRTNAKAEWYVWRDRPTNNWLAAFPPGARAWSYDEKRRQWYLHCFLGEQPDLDWDNPLVEAAMHDTLRFWLDKGVDGFRMDVVHLIGKDITRDDPPDWVEHGLGHVVLNDQPVTHQRLRRIRTLLDEYAGDRMAVGEVYLLDEAAMAAYHGTPDAPELHLSFNFGFLWAPWQPADLARRVGTTIAVLADRGATPTWVLSNHDVPRHRGRYGGDELDARMAALMLLMLPGTPFLYQGEELGLVDADIAPEACVDPGGRDGCRAPIPWETGGQHGWAADPWLPFAPDADERSVAAQRDRPDSILHWYRRLLALRRATPALHHGTWRPVSGSPDLFAWWRKAEIPADADHAAADWEATDGWFVYVNPTAAAQWADDSERAGISGATVVASTDAVLEGTRLGHELPPRVALIARRSGSM